MPGLCLRTDPTGGLHDARDGFEGALRRARRFDRYETQVLSAGPSVLVGSVADPDYPVRTATVDGVRLALEGRIYGVEDPLSELRPLVGDLLAGADGAVAADWLRRTDGEFVLWAESVDGPEAILLTDLFGRLPVYRYGEGAGVVLARDPAVVLDHADPAFDGLGLAQTLLFGYTLGERTLWDGVETLPPAALVRLTGGRLRTVERLHEFDFDRERHAHRSVAENAERLASLFVEACRRRAAEPGDVVVSLSGGHDSRSVLAGFRGAGVPFSAATFARDANDGDVAVAREVAAAADVDWQRYDVPSVTTDDAATLLDLKRGLNHVGMGFILRFFEALRADHGGDLTYATGDGGDKVVPDLTPARDVSDFEDLVTYTVEHNSVFPPGEAAALTGVDREALVESVASVLESYPESTTDGRYVHFRTHERGFNWLFEGEDRNRHYFWSTAPFYATPVFRYAMAVPDDQKAGDRFYREFLSALWPAAVDFDHADFGTPIDSRRYAALKRVRAGLARHPRLEDAARVLYRGELGYEYPETVTAVLTEQVETCDAVGEWFDGEALVERVDDGRGSRHQALVLLTLASAVERQWCGTDALARRPGTSLE